MSDAFIGRQSAIGLGLETTRGTAVAPVVWIPKTSGVLNPTIESVNDDSGYGVIDEIYDSFTTKNFSGITLEGIVRNDFIGYLFKLALGGYEKLTIFTGTVTGGTPARGDDCTDGILRKIITIGDTTYYCFDGTVEEGTITNGTWELDATLVTDFEAHLFTVLNSNTHPSATLCDIDPVAASYAPFCMINSFELNCEVADYLKFSAEFQGKQMVAYTSGSEPVPAYSDEPAFTASMAGVRFADNEAGLNSATEICIQNFRVAINKNLTDIQCFGSTDVDSLYNQQFGIEGDFEALYDNTTLRDMALDSDNKAVRFYAINSAENDFSALFVDLFKVGLNEWSKTDSNNDIVKQTMGYVGQYSANDGASIEVLLLNSNSTGY